MNIKANNINMGFWDKLPKPFFCLAPLADVTDAAFNSELTHALQKFTSENKPYVIAAAVVGITGLKEIILDAVAKFSRRNFKIFDNLDEAKDWLVAEKQKRTT